MKIQAKNYTSVILFSNCNFRWEKYAFSTCSTVPSFLSNTFSHPWAIFYLLHLLYNLADRPKLPDFTQYEDSGLELHVSNFVQQLQF